MRIMGKKVYQHIHIQPEEKHVNTSPNEKKKTQAFGKKKEKNIHRWRMHIDKQGVQDAGCKITLCNKNQRKISLKEMKTKIGHGI